VVVTTKANNVMHEKVSIETADGLAFLRKNISHGKANTSSSIIL